LPLFRDAGIHIFSVGIGLSEVEEIHAVSSQPGPDNTFLVRDFTELEASATSSRIVTAICEGIAIIFPANANLTPVCWFKHFYSKEKDLVW
jgi:hypothetical protein